MLIVLLRVVADTIVVATVLFMAAGTFAWSRAWLSGYQTGLAYDVLPIADGWTLSA
jgi:hypothetical protein